MDSSEPTTLSRDNGLLSAEKREEKCFSKRNDSNPSGKSGESEDVSSEKSDEIEDTIRKMICDLKVLQPHSLLPKPEAPRGLNDDVSEDQPQSPYHMPAIGKLIRERSNGFSAAIVKRLSSLKENLDEPKAKAKTKTDVTEFNLSGLSVIVKLKSEEEEIQKSEKQEAIKGRISFFSRSNCRDCTAVRRFLREKGLKFVEINIDVYPQREKELVERTGSSSVPQIFFNEKLFGGLVALNSLRNSGGFDRRVREMLKSKCPDDAPAPPVYGFDDDDHPEEEESTDEMIGIVRVLRQRLPIQDRLMKMKIVKNCFAGGEMVEAIIQHLDCGRRKVHVLIRFRFFILLFSALRVQ